LLPIAINPHLQSFLGNIFFNIMGFSSSPEVDEPSLGGTNDKG
jgi:hypothetical protein